MRSLLVLLLILSLTVVACGQEAAVDVENSPTVAPTVETNELDGEGDLVDQDSPRVGNGEGNALPPTWTPGAGMVQDAGPVAPAEVQDGTPLPTTTAEAETGGTIDEDANVYVVVEGDTLAQIANQFGVNVFTLAEVNNIENIDVIEVGQRLVIPQE